MDVDVTVAGAGLDDGDLSALDAGPDERRAAARDEDVHEPRGAEELGGLGVVGVVVDVLERVDGEAGVGEGRAARLDEGKAGLAGRRPALEDAGVPRAEAEAERVGRDVGTRLVDHRHDAERHAYALDAQPVLQGRTAEHAAERVVLARDLVERVGDLVDAALVEHEAVLERLAHACGPRAPEVERVGGDDVVRCGTDALGGAAQRELAHGPGGSREHRRGGSGEKRLVPGLGHVSLLSSSFLEDTRRPRGGARRREGRRGAPPAGRARRRGSAR